MKVLFWGTVLICLAFLLHLVIWKIRIPRRQTKVLLQIFFGTLITGILILWNSSIVIMGVSVPDTPLEFFHTSLFFVSLTLAYMITYSALEADSPSLVMIMSVSKAGSSGLTKKDFDESMTDDILVKPRIRDLLTDKMVYMDGDKYRLTPKGSLFARIFIFYRKLLNVQKGG